MRRVDGVIVYLNGGEIWRENIDWGNIMATNRSRIAIDGEKNEKTFVNCRNCRRNNSALLKVCKKEKGNLFYCNF